MDSDRLARYLAGEASPNDHADVAAWASANPINQKELERLTAAWRPAGKPGNYDVDQAWSQVAGRLGQTVADPEPIEVSVVPRPAVRWLAAAAVLVAVTGALLIRGRDRAVTYATTVGQQRTIVLPDGSKATMAPASTIVVPAGYGKPNRDLTLSGRAWFEVSHDDARPFRIAASGMMVEDLGTEFELVANGTGLQVTVVSGSVAVHRAGSGGTVTLGPQDVATISAEGQSTVDHYAPVERITSWRQGTLDFVNRPLSDVATELERWYDVELVLAPGLGQRPLNAPIPTANLTEALEIITTALGLTRADVGRVITLAPKP